MSSSVRIEALAADDVLLGTRSGSGSKRIASRSAITPRILRSQFSSSVGQFCEVVAGALEELAARAPGSPPPARRPGTCRRSRCGRGSRSRSRAGSRSGACCTGRGTARELDHDRVERLEDPRPVREVGEPELAPPRSRAGRRGSAGSTGTAPASPRRPAGAASSYGLTKRSVGRRRHRVAPPRGQRVDERVDDAPRPVMYDGAAAVGLVATRPSPAGSAAGRPRPSASTPTRCPAGAP